MIGDKPFRIKRYGRKLTLEISFNKRGECCQDVSSNAGDGSNRKGD